MNELFHAIGNAGDIFSTIKAINNYWWVITGLVGIIALEVEARVKLSATYKKCEHTYDKVVEHDRWINRARGRWGDP